VSRPDTIGEGFPDGADQLSRSLSATIVVLSAGHSSYLKRLLTAVLCSRPAPSRVQLIWSGNQPLPEGIPVGVDVYSIDPRSFDHGATRQLALEKCDTDLIVLISDDAEPVHDGWLAAITDPFADEFVAAVFGRQTARPDGPLAERIFRALRYPSNSFVIGLREVESEQGLSVPISDANGAYRVASLRAVGGFPYPCAYGEDQIVTVRLLHAGFKVAYAADAAVLHSHTLSWREAFGRGFNAGHLPRRANIAHSWTSFISMLRGSARLARGMAVEAWRQAGIAGLWAVVPALSIRGSGYIVGRVLARSESTTQQS
jgi:rhamnosyltransferase